MTTRMGGGTNRLTIILASSIGLEVVIVYIVPNVYCIKLIVKWNMLALNYGAQSYTCTLHSRLLHITGFQ